MGCNFDYTLFLYNSLAKENVMKRQLSLLALCLGSMGLAQAQTTTNTYSTTSTTTNPTYTSPVTTDSSNTAGNMAMSTQSDSSRSTQTMNNGSVSSANTTPNSTYSTNSMSNANMGTTTTTTTTNTYSTDANRSANANPTSDKGWGKEGKFGIYAGVNFSRFVNEPIPDGAYRAGWQAGIYGRSGGTIFGQLGVEYRTSTSNLVRNGTGQSTQTPGQIRGQLDQKFIAIPAYVGVRVGSALGLRLQIGAELSAMIINSANQFGIGNDDVRRTLLNGLAGAGINLGPLTLDAVYNLGLQNVFDNNDTKRQMLAFNLGFRF